MVFALFLISVFGFFYLSFGVPAMPGAKTYTQPDGTPVKLIRWGDEWLRGYATVDGYTVIKDANGFWVYAVLDPSGNLASSGVRADQQPPAGLGKFLKPKNKAVISKVKALAKSAPQKVVSPTGTGKLPVVLINFSDTTTKFNVADFESLFFSTSNTWSMRNYFKEVSYGKFDVQGVVVGWFTASKNHDYYGENDSSGNDRYPGSLVYEAAELADNNIDFSQYDTDGDCKVDVIAVIHQGTGEENGNYGQATDIWSHRWSLRGAYANGYSTFAGINNDGTYVTQDTCASDSTKKVVVDDYIIMSELYNPTSGNEKISTVGLMAHEYAHALGLPDLYDTDNSSSGIGEWGLMGSGSWNKSSGGVPGDRPAHLSAWSKAVLGWVTPNVITNTTNGLTIQAVENNKTQVYQIRAGNPGSTGEYFLLENRQKVGFDEGLPGSGLLVWHIDEAKTNNEAECNGDHGSTSSPDCSTVHYKVALEQADGNNDLENNKPGDSGDPFPGTSNKTAFSDTSTPSNKLYGGSGSGFSLENIRVDSNNNIVLNVNLSGVSYPDIDVPSSVSFGDIYLRDTSTQLVTVSNTGGAVLNVSSVKIQGLNASDFSITSSGSCGSTPFTVTPGGSCTISVLVKPSSVGSLSASLVIGSDDPDEDPVSVALSASGISSQSSGGGCSSAGYGGYGLILALLSLLMFRRRT